MGVGGGGRVAEGERERESQTERYRDRWRQLVRWIFLPDAQGQLRIIHTLNILQYQLETQVTKSRVKSWLTGLNTAQSTGLNTTQSWTEQSPQQKQPSEKAINKHISMFPFHLFTTD